MFFNTKNQIKIVFAVILVAVLFFIPRLTLELRLDELGSFWVIKDGFQELFTRSIQIQGQSPLYYLILWSSATIFGVGSVALRIPSLVFAICSCLLIFKLGELLFNRKVGLYTVFCLLCSFSLIQAATEARPYALGIMLALASSLALVKWSRTQSIPWLVSYGILAVITVYAHYLYAIVLLIHAPWILMHAFILQGNLRSKFWKQTLALGILVFISLIPSFYQLSILSAKSQSLAFVEMPSFFTLVKRVIVTDLLLLIILLVSYKFTIWRSINLDLQEAFRKYSKVSILFVCLFLFLPPILIYLFSHLTENSIFLERYYSARVIGLGLAGGTIIASIHSFKHQLILLITFISISAFGQYQFISSGRMTEGWKLATQKIQSANQCRVFLQSGFIESQNIQLLSDKTVSDFILSPVSYYLLTDKISLLPYSFETVAAKNYYSTVIEKNINDTPCLWILYLNGELFIEGKKLTPAPIFLTERLLEKKFHFIESFRFGLVELLYFKRGKN